jgi:hypothetical protein
MNYKVFRLPFSLREKGLGDTLSTVEGDEGK